MTDYSKLSVEDAEFVREMREVFLNGDETGFLYNGFEFDISYQNNKIVIYEDKEGGRNWYFDTPDDFFDVFLSDGDVFLNKLDELAEK